MVNEKRNGIWNNAYCVAFHTKHSTTKIKPGTISHEAFHVVEMLLRDRDLTLDDSSSEAYSYLLDWIVDKIYYVINTNNIKL